MSQEVHPAKALKQHSIWQEGQMFPSTFVQAKPYQNAAPK